MKRLLLYWLLGLATTPSCFSAGTNLWDELLNVTLIHIKRDGPDSDAAQFISMAHDYAWARREEIATHVSPFLTNQSPDKVAGAIEVLYRLRSYSPLESIGDFESRYAALFGDLDKLVYPHFEHFRELKNDRVYHALALYLGVSRTPQAKHELLEIARSPFAASAKEQALICLAWHRDPGDMNALLPFMLEDSPTARSLPYHFRNSYGEAALPYLRKAQTEAKSQATQREAEKELKLLEHK